MGGDELFGGYRRHRGIQLDADLGVAGDFLRALLAVPARLVPESWATSDAIDHMKRFVRSTGPRAERYADFLTALPVARRHALYSDAMRRDLAESPIAPAVIREAYEYPATGSALRRALIADQAVYLPDDVLALTDRLSMWHSLELRVPFLDRKLVEMANGLPDSVLVGGGQQKRVLRDLARRLLPRSVVEHRKQGFEAPMGAWLRGPLLPFFDSRVNEDSVEASGLLSWQVVKALRDEHVSGAQKHSKVLFAVLTLLGWVRQRKAMS